MIFLPRRGVEVHLQELPEVPAGQRLLGRRVQRRPPLQRNHIPPNLRQGCARR